MPKAIDAARARLLSHRTHRATGDVEDDDSLLPRRFDDDAGKRERAATIRLARRNRTRQHANRLAGRGLAAGTCGASTHRMLRTGTGRLDRLPARPAATGPVTATAPAADFQQDSATGTGALRAGWQVYPAGLLGPTLCQGLPGRAGRRLVLRRSPSRW